MSHFDASREGQWCDLCKQYITFKKNGPTQQCGKGLRPMPKDGSKCYFDTFGTNARLCKVWSN